MSVNAWRIVKRNYSKTAFSGEGARVYGGRWNSPGLPVVYTAGTQSLAALEMLVHLDADALLNHYVVAAVEIDASLITVSDVALFPRNWRDDPPPAKARAIGDNWLREGRSAVLELRSAIIPSEPIFLLNPRHEDFARLRIGKFESFRFDPRLGKRK
ncbi:MAG: RES family NAD+ phosphorylase [Bryobacteraceae bacterium]